jgi:hypothetical protein
VEVEADREMARIENARNAPARKRNARFVFGGKSGAQEGMCTTGGISPSVQSGKFGDGLKNE